MRENKSGSRKRINVHIKIWMISKKLKKVSCRLACSEEDRKSLQQMRTLVAGTCILLLLNFNSLLVPGDSSRLGTLSYVVTVETSRPAEARHTLCT
jgi:hypothetical protein